MMPSYFPRAPLPMKRRLYVRLSTIGYIAFFLNHKYAEQILKLYARTIKVTEV